MYNKPNKYWLGKIKLWFILHGNQRVSAYKICSLCHHCIKDNERGIRWVGYACDIQNKYQGRLMYKRDFSDIQFKEFKDSIEYRSDWICAEWVKDV